MRFLGYSIIVFIMLLGLCDSTFAQTTDARSAALLVLDGSFGDLFAGKSGVSGIIFGALSGICLLLGGALAAAVILKATVETAQDGEVFGKGMSSAWMPIRFVFGLSLVVPVSGGFCVAQFFAAWLAVQGVEAADEAFRSMALSLQPEAVSASRLAVPKSQTAFLAETALRQQLCLQWVIRSKKSWPLPTSHETPSGWSRVYAEGACGKVDLALSESLASGVRHQGAYAYGLSYLTQKRREDFARFRADHYAPIEKAAAQVALQILLKMDGSKEGVDLSILVKAVETFASELADKAASFADEKTRHAQWKASAANMGWLFAASWPLSQSLAENELQRLAWALPDLEAPAPSDLWREQAYDIGLYRKGELVLQEVLRDKSSGAGWYGARKSSATTSFFSGLVQQISESVKLPENYSNPFGALRQYASALQAVAEEGFYYSAQLNSIPMTGNPLTVAQESAPFSMPQAPGIGQYGALLCFMVVLLASFLGWVLPLAPICAGVWMGAVWVLSVAEALVCAPFWALAHLLPEGDGIAGKARAGWLLLFGLTATPLLALAGLVLGTLGWSALLSWSAPWFLAVAHSGLFGGLGGLVWFILVLSIWALVFALLGLWMALLGTQLNKAVIQWMGGLFTQGGTLSKHAEGALSHAGGALSSQAAAAARIELAQLLQTQMSAKMDQLGARVIGGESRDSALPRAMNELSGLPEQLKGKDPHAVLAKVETHVAAAMGIFGEEHHAKEALGDLAPDSKDGTEKRRLVEELELCRKAEMDQAQAAWRLLADLADALEGLATRSPDDAQAALNSQKASSTLQKAWALIKKALERFGEPRA